MITLVYAEAAIVGSTLYQLQHVRWAVYQRHAVVVAARHLRNLSNIHFELNHKDLKVRMNGCWVWGTWCYYLLHRPVPRSTLLQAC